MTNLLRLSACLFVLLSFNVKALVVNGCTIEAYTSCSNSDLSGAYLNSVDLLNAELINTNFHYADLSGAVLWGANLTNANLSFSVLSGANLSDANLNHSDLTAADLYYTDLSGANLSGANLNAAEMTMANFSYADLTYADLSFAITYSTDFLHATYNNFTIFDTDFDPIAAGMINISEVPLPAGIYLFLSGLVGLGLMRGRNG